MWVPTKNGITIFLPNPPDPFENPLAERVHRTLKVDATEEFKPELGFPTFKQAQHAVEKTIFVYTHNYPNGSLGLKSSNLTIGEASIQQKSK